MAGQIIGLAGRQTTPLRVIGVSLDDFALSISDAGDQSRAVGVVVIEIEL